MNWNNTVDKELIENLERRLGDDSEYEIEFLGHAIKYLDVLDPYASQWTFQTFDDRKYKNISLTRTLHGSFAENFETLWNLNKQGAGIFVTVNETDLIGRKKSNIRRVRAVFSDHDQANASIPNILSDRYLVPSMTVESSTDKFHAYWLVNDCDLEDFPSLQKAMAETLDSDRSVNDVCRILRLPGFLHQKDEPTWVKLHSVNSTQPYSVLDITNGVISKSSSNDNGKNRGIITSAPPQSTESTTSYGLSAIERAIKRVATAPEGERNNTLNRETYGIAQLVASGEISQEDSIFIPINIIKAATNLGLSDNETNRTVNSAWNSGILNPRVPIKTSVEAANDESYKPVLKEVSISNYMQSSLEPTTFAINQILPKRHVTLLSGHGGIGKSALGLVMAAHVASGSKFFGLQSDFKPAIYVSLEDEGNICLDRLKKITNAYSLNIPSIENNLKIIDGTGNRSILMEEQTRLSDKPTFTQTFTELKQTCIEQSPALIVIDNSSNSFGANENVRKDVVYFLTGLAQLAKETNASILLLAHVDKGAAKFGGHGNTYSGSTAWNNSVRSRLALIKDEETHKIRLIHEKANHSGLIHDRLFEFGNHGVPVPCKPPTKEEKEQLLEEDKEIILQSIVRANELEINIGTSLRPGNGSAMNCLNDIKCYDEYFSEFPDGKRRAASAIRALIDERELITEEYKNSSYQIKKRLILKK